MTAWGLKATIGSVRRTQPYAYVVGGMHVWTDIVWHVLWGFF